MFQSRDIKRSDTQHTRTIHSFIHSSFIMPKAADRNTRTQQLPIHTEHVKE